MRAAALTRCLRAKAVLCRVPLLDVTSRVSFSRDVRGRFGMAWGTFRRDRDVPSSPVLRWCSDGSTSGHADAIAAKGADLSTTRPGERRLMMVFTCKRCETRDTKTFSKVAYEQGVVIVRCGGCQALHLIADNLGWFGEERNVEEILASKQQSISKLIASESKDGALQFHEAQKESDLSSRPALPSTPHGN
mmetsp:Transcript_15441/g.41443  ORF Transcript_15441/g.41443 Transcript_15441/m.41443 type:complete len:191 (+) Transcript_15441:92-664(+)